MFARVVPRLAVWGVSCGLCVSGCSDGNRPPLPAVRGLPYDALYLPMDRGADQVRADVRALADLGATRVYFTCSEADLADDRKLRHTIDAAHALGLQVFAGPYFGGVFSGDEGDTARLYFAVSGGDHEVSRRGVIAPKPAHNAPALHAYLGRQVRHLLTYDVDGILLDEPWFPQPATADDYYPYDATSQAMFAAQFGHPMPDRDDAEVELFRQRSMTALLRELTDLAKQIRPGLQTALVVLPEVDLLTRDVNGTRDWQALADIPSLDELHTDPYWPTRGLSFSLFADNAARLQGTARRKTLRTGLWVQAYLLRAEDSDTVRQGLMHARRLGIDTIHAWLTPQAANEDDAAVRAHIADAFR